MSRKSKPQIQKVDFYLRCSNEVEVSEITLLGNNVDSLFSTNLCIIAPEAYQFIFYLTESIFFHADVIRDIGERGLGFSTSRIGFSVHSWRSRPLQEKHVPSLEFVIHYGNGLGLLVPIMTTIEF